MDQQRKARESGDIGEIEKHGVFTGHYAINPFNGERMSIWVAIIFCRIWDGRDYVGSGS